MTMEIVQDFPPNIKAIREAFPLTGSEIFAYGDIIYSPGSPTLPDSLIKHEEVHQVQQLYTNGGAESWWDKYILDKEFRAKQELEAHIAEWLCMKATIKDRNEQVRQCAFVARKLANRLYGKMFTYRQAMDLLRQSK